MHQDSGDNKNLLLALLIGMAIMIAWQFFYEMPRQREVAAAKQAEQARLDALPKDTHATPLPEAKSETSPPVAAASSQQAFPSRPHALEESPRIAIESGSLHGSIALKGARFDDLTLARYHETQDENSQEVALLSPSRTQQAYFAELGWLPAGSHVTVPDANTVWSSTDSKLTPGNPVILYWDNPDGVRFELEVSVDEHYLFTVHQRIINHSKATVSLAPYGLINRSYIEPEHTYYILHEGPLGIKDDALNEVEYKDLRENGSQTVENTHGWLGIADKYWLTAIIPEKGTFKLTYQHYPQNEQDRYQADMLGTAVKLTPGGDATYTTRLFAGAKEVWLLDKYSEEYGIPLFDRAVDFGLLYFLTKPIFLMLDYFNSLLGNFGLAILLLTVIIKTLLFPLANKSYSSMAHMKMIMPKMQEIREKYADDPVTMNKEVIALYKREGVNPAAGCLPMLIQIPVFFSLYKVLFVTIEMRHAPFFGWIHDLSSKDPTEVFTLFGLIPWNPPSMLDIGALPVILCITMILQQRLGPKPADPTQAMVMKYMPYFFLFVFAKFPAGLVIYWTWNNILSIIQQWVITRNAEKTPPNPPRRKAAGKEA